MKVCLFILSFLISISLCSQTIVTEGKDTLIFNTTITNKVTKVPSVVYKDSTYKDTNVTYTIKPYKPIQPPTETIYNLSFNQITGDYNRPFGGIEQWHTENAVNVPTNGVNTQRLDCYFRFVWARLEGATQGSYNWTYLDNLINTAITNKQKFSFGIMTVYPEGSSANGLVYYDGANSCYPQYLHNLMQSEGVRDYRKGSTWIPNYNSVNYQNRLLALHQAINLHLLTTSFNGVRYFDVINYIDVRGFGSWGEWHHVGLANYDELNAVGVFPTVNSFKKIIDAHTTGFPEIPLVSMIAGFDAGQLGVINNPPEIAYYLLTTKNNWGLLGWRRDQWGATDYYLSSYLENNNMAFNGVVFKNLIMSRWQTSPIVGEPPSWAENNYAALPNQVKLYHATSFGNGNYGMAVNSTMSANVRAAAAASGARIGLTAGTIKTGKAIEITLTWSNTGACPVFEKYDVQFELRSGTKVIPLGKSIFTPTLFLPGTRTITDTYSGIVAGTYDVYMVVKNNYRTLPLSIQGDQNGYFLHKIVF